MITVRILGKAGFINEGYPFNSFLADGVFLAEAPPDVISSLRRSGVDFRDLRYIYISHLHADHCWGMPFFTLNLFMHYAETGEQPRRITLLGPKGVRDHLRRLQIIATSEENPAVDWIDVIYDFIELDESTLFTYKEDYDFRFFLSKHGRETYGLAVEKDERLLFVYTSDTLWDDRYVPLLERKPLYFLCDLNGSDEDASRNHMSEGDILKHAAPITGESTRYLGTHIDVEKTSSDLRLEYVEVGNEYRLP
ncbi:MAG: MBL fold metallo-hydrolase [Spirochaetia bacterium]